MKRKKEIVLLSFLIFLLITINYNFADNAIIEFLEEKETGVAERIIDGDTAVINGNSTRFLGINTPEKGEKYYNEAKNFLSNLILNQTIELEYGKDKYDKYKRILAFIFLNEKNVNVEIVRNGFANVYILEDKKYENELRTAWEECILREKNLCEKSANKCANCIELQELDFKEQKIVFYNRCSYDCDLTSWNIKDEGRKKFIFENFVLRKNRKIEIIAGNGTGNDDVLYWKNEDYVWTATGDTLFLRDSDEKLVLWEEF